MIFMDALLEHQPTGVLPIGVPEPSTTMLPLAEFGQTTENGTPPPKPK
jgi:hypothetical protein